MPRRDIVVKVGDALFTERFCMSRFYAQTAFANPGLHLWREGTGMKLYLHPAAPRTDLGWTEFNYDLEPGVQESVCFMLYDYTAAQQPGEFEKNEHRRTLPRNADGTFGDVWFVQGSGRALDYDPRGDS